MALRLSVILVAALTVFLALSWESQASLVRREAPAAPAATPEKTSDTTKAIEDAFESFKSGLGDLVKNVQENDLVQNITQAFKNFGETVQQKGEELVNKLKSEGKKPAQQ